MEGQIMLVLLVLLAVHTGTGAQPVPTYVIPPSTAVRATTPAAPGTLPPAGIHASATNTPQAGDTPAPVPAPVNPPHAQAPGDTPPQQVEIVNTPVPITGTINLFPYPVEITSTLPLTVTIAPATETSAIPGLVYIFTLIMAKMMILAVYNIGQSNIFVKIYELLVTFMFVGVDLFVLYPLLSNGVVLYAGGLWFVFWIVTLYVDTILNTLSNLPKWLK